MASADRRMQRVSVFNETRWNGDWPPQDLAGAVAWLAAKLAGIAPEDRATATLELEVEDDYGSQTVRLSIEYRRLETQEEADEREAHAMRLADSIRARELRQLRELMAKYPEEEQA